MLPLGHMGIGRRIVAPWSDGLSARAIYLGALLPDLIDKPVYHLGVLLTGRVGADAGLISSTRTFGHTTLLVLLVGLFSWVRRAPFARALALGMASHLVLDTVGDFCNSLSPELPMRQGPIGGIAAVLWPLLGWHFPTARMPTFSTYATATFTHVNLLFEVLGATFLALDWRLSRSRAGAAP